MRTRKFFIAGAFGIATLIAGAIAASHLAAAQTLEKVTFAFNYSPTDFYVANWVALDKGYYAKAGLDVDLQYSKGSGDAITKVDTGRADLGSADTTTVIAADARGAKVKVVGMVFEKGPLNIFLWNDSPIKTPKDLEGKTLGSEPGGAARQLFPAFAKVVGFDPAKVSWVTIDPAAKISALLGKRVDGTTDLITLLPSYEKVMGVGNVRMMPWAAYGFDLYSIGFIASDNMIARKPEMIRRFLAATYAGYVDTFKDLDGSLAIMHKHVLEVDIALMKVSLERITLGLMKSPYAVAHGLGAIDRTKMCQTVSLVDDNMDLPNKVDCDQVFTDKLLPHVAFPD